MERIDMYLHQFAEHYQNTKRENEMVTKVATLFSMAKSYQDGVEYANPKNLANFLLLILINSYKFIYKKKNKNGL